MNEESRNN